MASLNSFDRTLIEKTKAAHFLTIIINEGSADELQVTYRRKDIRKLAHDIALAQQDYLIKNN